MAEILIIEDDLPLAQDWVDALVDAGHTASHCNATESAIKTLDVSWPDLIVLDCFFRNERGSMLNEGGMTFARRLLDISEAGSLAVPPILGVTGATPSQYFPIDVLTGIEKALKLEFRQHLHKPFAPEDLVAAVTDVLAGA